VKAINPANHNEVVFDPSYLQHDYPILGTKVTEVKRFTTDQLLDNGYGSCGHWAVFLTDLFACQGIGTSQIHAVHFDSDDLKLYAKDFILDNPDVDGEVGPPVQLWPLPGGSPHWRFDNHCYVMYDTTVYDPSFAVKMATTWDKYIVAVIDFYLFEVAGDLKYKDKAWIEANSKKVRLIHDVDIGGATETKIWPPFPLP